MVKKSILRLWTEFRSGGLSPLFLALWPVLSLYHQNATECPPGAVARSLVVFGGLGTAAILLFRVFFTDRPIASVQASIFVLLFSEGGAAFNALDRRVPDSFLGAGVEMAGLLALLALYLIILRAARPPLRRGWGPVHRAVAIGSAALFFSTALLGLRAAGRFSADDVPPADGPRGTAAPDAPDVYLIIVDGYGRADVLKDLLDFDNTPFIGALEKRGFWVAPRSRSNYPVTPEAVASMLNLRYLDTPSPLSCRTLIQQNQFQTWARKAGYQLFSFDSGWLITSSFPLSDVHIESRGRLNEFERSVLDRTVLGKLFPLLIRNDQRRAVERNLRELQALPRRPGRPKCVVAHLVLPHPPYFFDAAGGIPRAGTDFNLMGPWKEPGAYLDQLRFLNQRLTTIVDRLIAGSAVRPVILITSDHGSCFQGTVGGDDRRLIEERTSVLLAVAGPRVLTAQLNDSITPINAVRRVAETFFGKPGDPLPDKVFWEPPTREVP